MKYKTKIILATRTKKENFVDCKKKLEKLFNKNNTIETIEKIYIICDSEEDSFNIGNIKCNVLFNREPIGPTAFNSVIDELNKEKEDTKKNYHLLTYSKEVGLKQTDIKMLITEINSNSDLLVVGYKFEITDEKLNNELEGYYHNKNLIAYRIPWNTCAIWNFNLFNKYVSKFDEITAINPFNPIEVSIDGICSQTDHRGMEDGLAIAEAVSKSNKKIKYKLLKRPLLNWEVNSSDGEIKRHGQKLARKETVLRNFMAVRNYSVKDLENAEIKQKLP